ncbi:AfsR/SARP family transcriptional regulator [Streptosporangiaceae bacterium NEAU-GS5]|nr:AfsR/SARP family transcriptional regulator [Streptosporangiaceae bacterium NEAU-GS5]
MNYRKVVPTGSLIEELWGGRHPARVENALQAHVSRWRRRLAAMEPEAARPRLVTHPAGYQLMVDDDELDAAVLVDRLDRIRGQHGADPRQTAVELRGLLGLWRGPALGGLAWGPITRAAAHRLEELRIGAWELLFDAELRNGSHQQIISEIQEVLVRHSFNERFWQQFIVALYRSGRQVDALNVYRQLRRRLTEELGLEPSPAMRYYERAILEQDPRLNADPPAVLT